LSFYEKNGKWVSDRRYDTVDSRIVGIALAVQKADGESPHDSGHQRY
jgi:hypothetical protein